MTEKRRIEVCFNNEFGDRFDLDYDPARDEKYPLTIGAYMGGEVGHFGSFRATSTQIITLIDYLTFVRNDLIRIRLQGDNG